MSFSEDTLQFPFLFPLYQRPQTERCASLFSFSPRNKSSAHRPHRPSQRQHHHEQVHVTPGPHRGSGEENPSPWWENGIRRSWAFQPRLESSALERVQGKSVVPRSPSWKLFCPSNSSFSPFVIFFVLSTKSSNSSSFVFVLSVKSSNSSSNTFGVFFFVVWKNEKRSRQRDSVFELS